MKIKPSIFAGQDCFSISVLHLLAQTDLIRSLDICEKRHVPSNEKTKPNSDKTKVHRGLQNNANSNTRLCKNARYVNNLSKGNSFEFKLF